MTLLEIMIAMVVLAIALMGLLSLVLVTQSFNQSAADANVANKACQEVMEQVLATSITNITSWHDSTFIAKVLHPSAAVGRVLVESVDPEAPNTLAAGGKMYRVTVSIDTSAPGLKVTQRPVKVALVTWRANR
jgi:Tfp pilus assembly protein PilV